MKIVTDTSPLIALAKIDHLWILKRLFKKVLIPGSVSAEFLKNCTQIERSAFEEARRKFLSIVEPEEIYPFNRQLDVGEKDALSLAIEKNAAIIIDDRKGFNEAKEKGLIAISTRAVLKIAEEKSIISDSREIEKALREKAFFPPDYEC